MVIICKKIINRDNQPINWKLRFRFRSGFLSDDVWRFARVCFFFFNQRNGKIPLNVKSDKSMKGVGSNMWFCRLISLFSFCFNLIWRHAFQQWSYLSVGRVKNQLADGETLPPTVQRCSSSPKHQGLPPTTTTKSTGGDPSATRLRKWKHPWWIK